MIEDTLHELTKAMNALEATVARIGDALVANGLKMVFEDRTTPPPKAEPKPSKEPVAEAPTPVPEKRGPGRPKNPPKVEPAPEPVVEAALEPPAEVDETQVSSISYTVDDLRTRLIKIATLVNVREYHAARYTEACRVEPYPAWCKPKYDAIQACRTTIEEAGKAFARGGKFPLQMKAARKACSKL